jgi:chromate reductase
VKVVAISGSLRRHSVNTALLRAAVRLAPAPLRIKLFDGMGALPLFNPDLEPELPASVAQFHALVAASDALLIASPEYAHGITGAMKNALDWLVGLEEFAGKRVAILNGSGRARHADASLREILTTMSACIVERASRTIALPSGATEAWILDQSPEMRAALEDALRALRDDLAATPTPAPVFPL